jgi:hypothetical protein
MNSPSIETAATPASVDVGIEPTVEPNEPNKPISPVNQEAWYDIEVSCSISAPEPADYTLECLVCDEKYEK